MTDGNNNIVYNTDISVDKIKANQDYPIKMDNTVTIPKGVTCCIRITCSSKGNSYAAIPTLNTTNRTNPNTYMSTLKMQTHAKSLNIRYTYRFRQVYPLIVMLIEILILLDVYKRQLSLGISHDIEKRIRARSLRNKNTGFLDKLFAKKNSFIDEELGDIEKILKYYKKSDAFEKMCKNIEKSEESDWFMLDDEELSLIHI